MVYLGHRYGNFGAAVESLNSRLKIQFYQIIIIEPKEIGVVWI